MGCCIWYDTENMSMNRTVSLESDFFPRTYKLESGTLLIG
jgi:hypothetical protein